MKNLFISAAFRLSTGEILCTGPCHDIEAVPEGIEIIEEGFVDSNGNFYNRQQASEIVNKNNVQSKELLGCIEND
jgi:hypothetical protein